jgi:hypothetical protein
MTPLANRYMKYLTTPVKDRPPLSNKDNVNVWDALYGCRCFEITAVVPLIEELGAALKGKMELAESVVDTYSFLPAEKTWLEYVNANGKRTALYLENIGENRVMFLLFMDGACADVCTMQIDRFLSYTSQNKMDAAEVLLIAFTYYALAIVNTPRVVGRKEHEPNAGTQKRLNRSRDVTPFKLLPWSEIKLEVTKPEDIDDGEPHEGVLTGKRALHFCRSHIRVKRGKIEYVTSHWRGDAALGIKQSRYVVA